MLSVLMFTKEIIMEDIWVKVPSNVEISVLGHTIILNPEWLRQVHVLIGTTVLVL